MSTHMGKAYELLTSDRYEGALGGSVAVRLYGTLYRPQEEDFHDLDFNLPWDDVADDIIKMHNMINFDDLDLSFDEERRMIVEEGFKIIKNK